MKRITMDFTAPSSLLASLDVFSESMKSRKNLSMVRFGIAPVSTPAVLRVINKKSKMLS